MTAFAQQIRRQVLQTMAGSAAVVSIPIAGWWFWANQERKRIAEVHRTKIRLPNTQDTYDFLITEKCQAGDVLLFDRRPEHCAAGPWASLACLAAKFFLTGKDSSFDHAGLIVPGYIRSKADLYEATNLLLLEATPQGIVARPLKDRLEQSFSKTIVLLQLNCPGERRNEEEDPDGAQRLSVERTRKHVERELRLFRDQWVALGSGDGQKKSYYPWIHSTICLGGALLYGLGLQDYSSGPVSPSAYLVLMGLIKASAAQSIDDKENRNIKPEDLMRNYQLLNKDAVRLRPGWRFLSPITIKEGPRL